MGGPPGQGLPYRGSDSWYEDVAGRSVDLLDTSIVFDEDALNVTFCHSLNHLGEERRLYTIQALVDCKEWIKSTFAGADAFIIILGGNDVASDPTRVDQFARDLLNICWE